MLKIAGVVILYYPDTDVYTRLSSYIDYIEKLYVLDNSETSGLFDKAAYANPKVIYISDNENKGISFRLNQAAAWAMQEGYEWLLTMDQDSYFPEKSMENYLYCISSFKDKNKTGMFGVETINLSAERDCTSKEVAHLITSGSIVNLKLFDKIGNFDEALFIDKVDHEYCLRIHLHYFKVIQFGHIFLHHNLGTVTLHRSLKNLALTPRVLHSPIRMYYILRNYFYLKSKYNNQFEDSFKEMKSELLNRIKNNLLYGKHRGQLLRYLIKGYQDYRAGNMGKIKS